MQRSIIHILILLAFTLLVSAGFYIAQLLYTSAENARSSKIYEQSLIASINQYEYLPALLANEQSIRQIVQSDKKDHITTSEKLKFITQRSGADAAYIMDNKGTVKASSNYDEPNGGFMFRNYAFRPYFIKAITEKKRQFYYAQGATTGIPGFFISSPLLDKEQRAIGVAVVKLDLRHWEKKWQESGEQIVVSDENNIIILSSAENWRYKSIGKLPQETLSTIDEQQQFPGIQHESLYSDSIHLGFASGQDRAFWFIDKKLFLVNRFNIPGTDWKLYYLVKHDAILTSSLVFFAVLLSLTLMGYLIYRTRTHIIETNNKHRVLEIKRREELQTVMDNIHIGVILFSSTGTLLSANQHARHLLLENAYFDPNKPIHINQLIKLDHNNYEQMLLEDISAPAYHETQTTLRNKNSIPVMFAISKVNTMDQEVYLMTLVNIQRRKAVEDKLVVINEQLEDIVEDRTQALQETQNKLMQKNKAAALGSMAATIVHELSQPLTAMNNSIAAINAKINNSDWNGVLASAKRLTPLNNKMQEIIKLLKFFSYQDTKAYEVIKINDIVQQSINNVKDTLQKKSITMEKRLSDDQLLVNVNPLKFDLVLSNIIQNAIDALESKDKAKIIISTTHLDKFVIITIEDNGGGVDQEIMQKMFSPYFTTKQVGKGLGLGLAITYEIIQEYGGKITAKNIKEGACFTIQLPRVENLTVSAEQ